MNATIKYLLSEKGQKAAILAGKPGTREQTIHVPSDDPEFAAVVDLGMILRDGSIVLDLTWTSPQCEPAGATLWDELPTVSGLLTDLITRRDRKLELNEKEGAQTRAATLATIREQRTRRTEEAVQRIGSGDAIYVQFVTLAPNWPYPKDAEIVASSDAQAFIADLAEQNQGARAKAEAEADRLLAEQTAKLAAEAVAEATRRASLGLRDGDDDYSIDNGALTEVPPGMWQSHKRGKNWMATIEVDPSQAGGFARSFASKAKGEYFYIVPALAVGQAVEFGADYYSGSGNKSANRWYGYVVSISDERLVLHHCATGKAAIKEGAEFARTTSVVS